MINQVALMGRLTKDPELKHTPSGVAVTTFSLAVSRSYCKQGEERQTDFIDITAWRNTAEFICRFFGKGQMMAVEGMIQTRTYTDKDGKNRKAFEIVARDASFCGDRREQTGAPPPTQAAASEANEDFSVIDDDDDIPF